MGEHSQKQEQRQLNDGHECYTRLARFRLHVYVDGM